MLFGELCNLPMNASATVATPLNVFVSYSHKDEPLKDDLVTFLKALQHIGKIKIWEDRAIAASDEWNAAILQALDSADIIILLVTARFIGSDFCFSKEMSRALMHHEQKTAHVIPVIMTPCAWQQMPFAKLQVLPTDGKPVIEWRSQDAGLTNVMQGITRVVDTLYGVGQLADDSWDTGTLAAANTSSPSSVMPTGQQDAMGSTPLDTDIAANSSLSTKQQRLALFQQLSALSKTTFDAVVYALRIPPPLLPPPMAPQNQRVAALLHWAESRMGCGLQELEAVMLTVQSH